MDYLGGITTEHGSQFLFKSSSWTRRPKSYCCSDANAIFTEHGIQKTPKIDRYEFQAGDDVQHDENTK